MDGKKRFGFGRFILMVIGVAGLIVALKSLNLLDKLREKVADPNQVIVVDEDRLDDEKSGAIPVSHPEDELDSTNAEAEENRPGSSGPLDSRNRLHSIDGHRGGLPNARLPSSRGLRLESPSVHITFCPSLGQLRSRLGS